jgi:hypothetical protein
LEAAQIPCDKKNAKCDPQLARNITELIKKCVAPGKHFKSTPDNNTF